MTNTEAALTQAHTRVVGTLSEGQLETLSDVAYQARLPRRTDEVHSTRHILPLGTFVQVLTVVRAPRKPVPNYALFQHIARPGQAGAAVAAPGLSPAFA